MTSEDKRQEPDGGADGSGGGQFPDRVYRSPAGMAGGVVLLGLGGGVPPGAPPPGGGRAGGTHPPMPSRPTPPAIPAGDR